MSKRLVGKVKKVDDAEKNAMVWKKFLVKKIFYFNLPYTNPLFKSFCLNTKTCSWRKGNAGLFPQGTYCLLQFFKEQQKKGGDKK